MNATIRLAIVDRKPVKSPNLIRPLGRLTRHDAATVGAKAANLGELMTAGFPVPPGVVLSAEAFADFVAGLPGPATPATVLAATLSPALVDAIVNALGSLSEQPLAVRSSSLAEDLAGASFAGQYETVLDVRGVPAVLDAVRQCFASVYADRVVAYRAERKLPVGDMAVLVQRLVAAECAGVCFTANPVTGQRAEAIVSAVRGLGERLVSGEASPDEWVVDATGPRCVASPEGVMNATLAGEVAALARRVEAHFGMPQDIEWAWAEGQLFLLQARPITSLPEAPVELVPVKLEVPTEGYWMREDSHMPQPLSPFISSTWLDLNADIFAPLIAETGMMIDDIHIREIGGLAYMRIVPMGGKDRQPPPLWLMRILFPVMRRFVPSIRRRIDTAIAGWRSGWAQEQLDAWWGHWRAHFTERMNRLRHVDLAALSVDGLRAHLVEVLDYLHEATRIHTRQRFGIMTVQGRFFRLVEKWLGWSESKTVGLFTGLSEMSIGPASDLEPLAVIARSSPAVAALLERPDEGTLAGLRKASPEFGAAYDAYQERWGCRAIRLDIVDPNFDEDAPLLLRLLRGSMVRKFDAAALGSAARTQRESLRAEALEQLADRSAEDRERFVDWMDRAAESYPIREDDEVTTLSAPVALMRRAALELGTRIASAGLIERPDDCFYLRHDEALEALGGAGEWKTVVRRRRGERAWVMTQVGREPRDFGPKPADPPKDVSFMPAELAELMACMMWFSERHMAPGQSSARQDPGGGIVGIAASPGSYTGTARVIHSEGEFARVQPGDVLVCSITSPVWSVLFSIIGGLVTDTGGLLSHPAIIAREYGVPAVVATGNATALVRDGQRVRVDGTSGRVDVLA